jgi:hypothetical protein
MADVLVAMAQYARRAEERKTVANDESKPSLAFNAEIKTSSSQQGDETPLGDDETESLSVDGTEQGEEKAAELDKHKRTLVKLASLEIKQPGKTTKEEQKTATHL